MHSLEVLIALNNPGVDRETLRKELAEAAKPIYHIPTPDPATSDMDQAKPAEILATPELKSCLRRSRSNKNSNGHPSTPHRKPRTASLVTARIS